MSGRTASPDSVVEALLEEVVGIRRELESIGRRLGEPAGLPAASAPPRPTAQTGDAGAEAAPRSTGEDPRAWPATRTTSGVPIDRESAAEPSAVETPQPVAGGSLWAPPGGTAGAGSGSRLERASSPAGSQARAQADDRSHAEGAVHPAVPSSPAAPPPPAGSPAAPRVRRRRLTPERMLAIGGAVVTILGVGFLLAVAIAAGLFGPVPRVVALAVLSVILGLVAGRMHARRSSDAAVALAATSSAAAFAAVVATTAIYAWLPAFAGLVLALLLAGAGVFVAHRWRSQVLAGLEYVQVILVLPMILQPATDIAFVEFSVFAAIAYVPVVVAVVEHRWLPLFRVASLGLGAVAFIGLIGGTAGSAGGTVRVLTSIVVFLLIAACATALTEVAVLGTALGLSAIAILWLRDETALLGLELTAPVAGAVALATAIAAVRYRGAIRTMLTIGAVTHLLVATVALPVSDHVVAVLLAFEALVLVVAARQRASLPMWGASIAFTLAAIAGLIVLVPVPAIFSTSAVAHATRWEAVVVGLLLAGVGAAHVLSVRDIRVPRIDPAARVLAGLAVGLYGASSAIVAVGLLPGASEVQAMAANVVTTIVWVAVAVGMILRPASPVTRAGYALLIAAIAKLFLADLHTVAGVLRAVLFVLTGLALIGASSQIRKHTDAGTGDGRGDDGPAADGSAEASTDALRED